MVNLFQSKETNMKILIIILSLFSYLALAAEKPFTSYPLGGTLIKEGAIFRVWAPNANHISISSDSNSWPSTELTLEGQSGIWSGQISKARIGDHYKYTITNGTKSFDKADPEGRQINKNGWSVLVDPHSYQWKSGAFVGQPLESAIIYELHVGSFNPSGLASWGGFLSVADKLDYLANLGINYIELLPVHKSARPFDWGYGVSLPSTLEDSYGTPDEFKKLIDLAHQHGIGVLIDVVHNHYSGESALKCFDGNCTGIFGNYFYPNEHATAWGPRPNFSDSHVRDFISNNIRNYLEEYHVDGFRWDAVPYISNYIDYSADTKTSTNKGENIDGVSLLQKINQETHLHAGAISIAEYFGVSTSVTDSTLKGGLGFDSHWTGLYSIVRAITQSSIADINIKEVANALVGTNKRVIFTESHDDVGHPPEKLRIPMRIDPLNPGSQKARKRSLLGAALLMTTPGVPMIFQGQEFLEDKNFVFPTGTPLDWKKAVTFSGIVNSYQDLISLRKNSSGITAALMESNIQVFHENENEKVLAYRRWSEKDSHQIVVIANLGSQSFSNYKIGLPQGGNWSVLFSSDDLVYSSDFSGTPKVRSFSAEAASYDGFPYSKNIELAPFTVIVLEN